MLLAVRTAAEARVGRGRDVFRMVRRRVSHVASRKGKAPRRPPTRLFRDTQPAKCNPRMLLPDASFLKNPRVGGVWTDHGH